MDWNDIGWKCKRQKKLIEFLIVVCIVLIGIIIYLHVTASDIRYNTMADMAAEAATHTYWRDMYDYETRQTEKRIAALDEEYSELVSELESLKSGQ